jgi:hypothetical protein
MAAVSTSSLPSQRPCPLELPPWLQHLVEEGQIEKFVGLDMSDADTVFDRCLEACLKIKKVAGGGTGSVVVGSKWSGGSRGGDLSLLAL